MKLINLKKAENEKIKHAVSYVIYNKKRTKIMIVQRPYEDENLPGIWGLPAGNVREKEAFNEAVIRSGREKLGVKLKPVKFIGRGDIKREDYVLHMEEYEVQITSGEPKVPQPIRGITQYTKWHWGVSSDLRESASKGSLCSQIYLMSLNEKW